MWFMLFLAIVVVIAAWILAPLFGVRRSWAPFEHATVAVCAIQLGALNVAFAIPGVNGFIDGIALADGNTVAA